MTSTNTSTGGKDIIFCMKDNGTHKQRHKPSLTNITELKYAQIYRYVYGITGIQFL